MVIESALLMNATYVKELVPSRHVTAFNSPHFDGTPPGIQTSRNSTSKGACVSMACKIDWWRNLCGGIPLQNDPYTSSYIRMLNGAVLKWLCGAALMSGPGCSGSNTLREMAYESSTRDTGYGAGFCLILSYFLVDCGCCFGPVVVIDAVGSQVKKSLSVMLAGAG
jgi:hypothetical protein